LAQDWPDSLTPWKPKLNRDDPPPVIVVNPRGSSPLLLLGDHAGREIPVVLGDLGVAPEALDRHVAWDIGVAGLGERLAWALDAAFIRQTYSRLVIDCNRRPGAADCALAVSDGVAIPGNANLEAADLAWRVGEIYAPYQAEIARVLDLREELGRPTLLVSLHSFTPVFQGVSRPWRFGVLHRGDSPFSIRMLRLLREALGDDAGDNEPYAMDATDNTVPLHADARGLDYLELEVRQDLIAEATGQDAAASFLARLLAEALGGGPGPDSQAPKNPPPG
jgi:predicted N-formylglutamate amidohydrolase